MAQSDRERALRTSPLLEGIRIGRKIGVGARVGIVAWCFLFALSDLAENLKVKNLRRVSDKYIILFLRLSPPSSFIRK